MMKLGTQTGSLINHFMSTENSPNPVVGMGVTFLSWTDRSPGTIKSVFTQGKNEFFSCTADDYKRIDNNGLSEIQEYEYTTNPDGYETFYRKDKKTGDWVRVYKNENDRWVKSKSGSIRIGHRERYYDHSF